jgi:hypothetical protein
MQAIEDTRILEVSKPHLEDVVRLDGLAQTRGHVATLT